jgi:dsDNA-binding SOS-regulon protein
MNSLPTKEEADAFFDKLRSSYDNLQNSITQAAAPTEVSNHITDWY